MPPPPAISFSQPSLFVGHEEGFLGGFFVCLLILYHEEGKKNGKEMGGGVTLSVFGVDFFLLFSVSSHESYMKVIIFLHMTSSPRNQGGVGTGRKVSQ